MVTRTPAGAASLPMYPFTPLRDAWQVLWSAVAARCPELLPRELTWDDDVHALWDDPALVVSQSCGWPVATSFADRLVPIGAFDPRIPGARAARYRSLIVASVAARPRDLAGARAAVNSLDSLSGWISLLVGVLGPRPAGSGSDPGRWPGTVVTTGGHRASLAALRAWEVDVAAIDSLTFALIRDIAPEEVAGLVVVGKGPLIPCTPVVMRRGAAPADVAAVQEAFVDACADPTTEAARRALRIRGFVPRSAADYDPVASLLG